MGKILIGAALDNRDIDPRQCEFRRQHQSCWTSARYNDCMLGHPRGTNSRKCMRRAFLLQWT